MWYDSPVNTMTTLAHCWKDKGFPFQSEEIRMLTNLRVVVMIFVTNEPKWLMMRKMKFCPTTPHKQKSVMSHAAFGCSHTNLIAAQPPPPGHPNMKMPIYIELHMFMHIIICTALVFGYLPQPSYYTLKDHPLSRIFITKLLNFNEQCPLGLANTGRGIWFK